MRIGRIGSAVALVAAGVFALSGCASGGGAPNTSATAIITTNGSEPQNPLVPTNTNEVGGGKIVDSIFAGLIYYDAAGKPLNDVATSVESSDAQNYTITIRDDAVFSNGEKVTSKSFVDAWSYGALLSNKQLSSHFFEEIQGFSFSDESPLTGLKVVSDTVFTVALTQPTSDFPLRLGAAAYFPLPSVAYDDIAAFGENPVGNGPYKLAKQGAWQHNERIDLVESESYSGPLKPQNGGLSIIFYASPDAAYADLLGGNLDIVDAIPDSALSTYRADLGDRAINQPAAIFQSFTIPERLDHFSGEEGNLRRQAMSHAINRDEISSVIFSDTRTPAHDFTSPVIDGYSPDLPGADVLTYDPAKATTLWAQADAISPWSGSFQIAYNADGGHQGWVDAVTNSLKNVLGINASGAPYPTFAELRTLITNRSISTAFRTGWQGDYPGLYNFLGPLYSTDAGSNDGDYSNPEFDALLKEGLTQTQLGDANAKFDSAQQVLFRDLPGIPLWYATANGGYGQNVHNVQVGWNSVPLYYQVTRSNSEQK